MKYFRCRIFEDKDRELERRLEDPDLNISIYTWTCKAEDLSLEEVWSFGQETRQVSWGQQTMGADRKKLAESF